MSHSHLCSRKVTLAKCGKGLEGAKIGQGSQAGSYPEAHKRDDKSDSSSCGVEGKEL